MKALAPGFLIAMPQLQDPNFQRAVVLMIEHAEGGSMGLIVNRTADLTLEDLAKSQQITLAAGRATAPIHVGGPVEPYRGFVLHDCEGVEEKSQVMPGLYLSVTHEALALVLGDAQARLRFCLGYAGWGAGQVDHELAQGSWLFTEANAEAVLGLEPSAVWEDVIKGMGVDPAMLVTTGGIN